MADWKSGWVTVVRSDNERIVVAQDIEPVEKPQLVF